MAEKSKQISITIKRNSRPEAKTILATGFRVRIEKSSGFLEIDLEHRNRKGERVLFDPVVLKPNLQGLKQYVASLGYEPDELALREEISVSDQEIYSNIIHGGQLGGRSETNFSFFRYLDWIELSRAEGKSVDRDVVSEECLVVMSTPEFQKKLLLEIIAQLM